MKKVLTVMVCMLMTITSWAYDVEIDGLFYNLDEENKTAEVTYDQTREQWYAGAVVIPETISHNDVTYTVTRIGLFAFEGCYELTSVDRNC